MHIINAIKHNLTEKSNFPVFHSKFQLFFDELIPSCHKQKITGYIHRNSLDEYELELLCFSVSWSFTPWHEYNCVLNLYHNLIHRNRLVEIEYIRRLERHSRWNQKHPDMPQDPLTKAGGFCLNVLLKPFVGNNEWIENPSYISNKWKNYTPTIS